MLTENLYSKKPNITENISNVPHAIFFEKIMEIKKDLAQAYMKLNWQQGDLYYKESKHRLVANTSLCEKCFYSNI